MAGAVESGNKGRSAKKRVLTPFLDCAVIERSYRCAATVARRSGSNFYGCFSLLPRDKRRAVTALYAFARQTDDFGDAAGAVAERRRQLEVWRGTTARALLSGRSNGLRCSGDPSVSAAVRSAATDLLPALADSVTRYSIPSQYLVEMIDGVIADQHQTRFDTFEQLEHYCYRVASTVGLACMHIWQYTPPLPYSAAVDCGVAFQLTNILRDLREDAARDRLYLPRQLWRPLGLTEAEMFACEPSPAMLRLINGVAARARVRFFRGWAVYDSLHRDGRRMFSMMWRTYRALLESIEADPAAALRHRVRLGHRDRLRLIGSHVAGPLFRRLAAPTVDPRYRGDATATDRLHERQG